jgi:hypothetical protein
LTTEVNANWQPISIQANVGGVNALLQQSETYIEIDVNVKKAQCLLDLGCDRSVVPRKLVKTAVLTPTAAELYAANGTKIPVLG